MRLFGRVILDPKLGANWRAYLLQSIYATLCVLALLLVLRAGRAVTIASMGATTFILFAMPSSIAARPRSILGGHFIGLIVGLLCGFLPHPPGVASAIVYGLAIGITMFLMVATNTEHPPAAGTALAVAIGGSEPTVFWSILISALLLAAISRFLGPRLLNLV